MYKIKFQIDKKPTDYQGATSFMENHAHEVYQKKAEELIWLTSHQPVFTAGVSAKESDLLSSKIPVIKTNRGGKYTYHDPGMRIIYTMLDLKNVFYPEKPDVAKFVKMLEDWIISVLAKLGIKGEIRKDRVGIWVIDPKDGQEKKIAAIGIKLRKWVSFHGLALNINPDMSAFEKIVPCGIKDFGITSLHDLGVDISLEDLDKIIKNEFFQIFKNYQ